MRKTFSVFFTLLVLVSCAILLLAQQTNTTPNYGFNLPPPTDPNIATQYNQNWSLVDSILVELGANLVGVSIVGSGNGSGTVQSGDLHVNCAIIGGIATGSCIAFFVPGSTIVLTATASAGNSFGGFNGSGCTTSPCTLTLNANNTITANFAANQTNLTVTAIGTGSGTVNSTDASIACVVTAGVTSGTCSAPYAPGTSVTLNAAATGGSSFVNWNVSSCGTAMTCVLTVSSSTSVSVQFNPPPAAAPIAFVQASSSSGVFPSAQTAGDVNLVTISWNDNTTTITSITDGASNAYTLGKATTLTAGGAGWAQVGSAVAGGWADTNQNPASTCTLNATVGDLIKVFVFAPYTGTLAGFGVTDTSDATAWSHNTGAGDSTSGQQVMLFYKVIATAKTGDVITVTPATFNSTKVGIFCTQYSNGTLPSQATILGASITSGTPTSTTTIGTGTNSLTINGANDLVTMDCVDSAASSTSFSTSGSYTLVPGLLAGLYSGAGVDRKNVTSGPVTPVMGDSNGTSTKWKCVAADFKGNAAGSGMSQSVYYSSGSSGIAAAAANNTIAVTWNPSAPVGAEIKGLEYSGILLPPTLDGTPAGASGTSSAPASGNTTTTSVNSLLLCPTTVAGTATITPATNFTSRILVSPSGNDVTDRFPVTAATYGCSPTLNQSGNWITQLLGIEGANQGSSGPTTFPLTLTCSGNGNGVVTSNTGGINCQCTAGVSSGTCSASFNSGANVTITATPQ